MRRITAGLLFAGALVAASIPLSTVSADPTGGALAGGGSVLEIDVTDAGGIPADAQMAALHIAVVRGAGPGFVTAWPCVGDPPITSVVNFAEEQATQSLVLAPLSDDGSVCVIVSETTDVVVDLAGYVPAGSDFTPLDRPTRIVDTRVEVSRLGPDRELRLPIAGFRGVGEDAVGAAYTITVVGGSEPGFATAAPCDRPAPPTSTVNWSTRAAVPNFAITALGDDGSLCLTASSEVDVLVDLVAWIPESAAGYELFSTPQRIFDSRDGTGTASRAFDSEEVRSVPVAAPDGAVAVIGNLTATAQAGRGFVTAFPCGGDAPEVAALNWSGPPAIANGSLIKLGEGDEPCVLSSGPAHLVYDAAGFVTSTDFYTPIDPVRLHDTREGWEPICPFVPIVRAIGHGPEQEVILYAVDGDSADDRRIPIDGRWREKVVVSPDCEKVFGIEWGTEAVAELSIADGTERNLGRLRNGRSKYFDVVEGATPVLVRFLRDGEDGPNVRAEIRHATTHVLIREAQTDAYTPRDDGFDHHHIPFWFAVSADASFAVGSSSNTHPRTSVTIDVADFDAGEIFSLDLPLTRLSGVDVAPDGRSFIVHGQAVDSEGTYQVFLVFARNGAFITSGFADDTSRFAAAYRGNGHIIVCMDNAIFDQPLFDPPRLVEVFVNNLFAGICASAIS